VVVLDVGVFLLCYISPFRYSLLRQEIEKTDEKTLWSLLMPWELGRCSFEAGARHIDVHNVIWLGTSNIGHDLVFKHHQSRARPDDLMTREEYVELMDLLRPLVSERLGVSNLLQIGWDKRADIGHLTGICSVKSYHGAAVCPFHVGRKESYLF
jgi:hypothetical protein